MQWTIQWHLVHSECYVTTTITSKTLPSGWDFYVFISRNIKQYILLNCFQKSRPIYIFISSIWENPSHSTLIFKCITSIKSKNLCQWERLEKYIFLYCQWTILKFQFLEIFSCHLCFFFLELPIVIRQFWDSEASVVGFYSGCFNGFYGRNT